MRPNRIAAVLAAVIMMSSMAGCKGDRYPKVTAAFADAVTHHAAALKSLYEGVNESELSVYTVQRLMNTTLDVADDQVCRSNDAARTLRWEPSVMLQPRFSETQIQRRVGLVTEIGLYASSLADLASGTAPEDVGSKVADLQKALAQTAKGAGGSAKDFDAAGEAATIGAVIARVYLERRRTEKLSSIIARYAPVIDSALYKLDGDAQKTHDLVTLNAEVEYTDWVTYYNVIRTFGLPKPITTRTFKPSIAECRPLARAAGRTAGSTTSSGGGPAALMLAVIPPNWCATTPADAPFAVTRAAPAAPAAVDVNVQTDARYLALREVVLKRIRDSRNRWDAAKSVDPHETICSLWTAHRRLVAFAEAPDRAQNATDFLSAVAQYRADAQTLFDAYNKLTNGT